MPSLTHSLSVSGTLCHRCAACTQVRLWHSVQAVDVSVLTSTAGDTLHVWKTQLSRRVLSQRHTCSLSHTHKHIYEVILTLALLHRLKHTHTHPLSERPDGVTAWAVGLLDSLFLLLHQPFFFSSHLPPFSSASSPRSHLFSLLSPTLYLVFLFCKHYVTVVRLCRADCSLHSEAGFFWSLTPIEQWKVRCNHTVKITVITGL